MASYGDTASSEVEKIMLRFRPIAPKPAAAALRPTGDALLATVQPMLEGKIGGGGSLGRRKKCSSAAAAAAAGRGRRKKFPDSGHPVSTVQVIDSQLQKWVAAALGSAAVAGQTTKQPSAVATLPLLPERPAYGKPGEQLDAVCPWSMNNISAPTNYEAQWGTLGDYNGNQQQQPIREKHHHSPTTSTKSVVVVESASAGEASIDAGMWLCCCDEEQAKWGLHADASPAFLSDASGRQVTWTNAAYRDMVQATGSGRGKLPYYSPSPDVPNLISMRWAATMALPLMSSSAFSCRVTVRHASTSLTAPCDVWRLADGNMVWKLDVDAALSLSR